MEILYKKLRRFQMASICSMMVFLPILGALGRIKLLGLSLSSAQQE
jgi:hypothetical protein